MYQQRSRFRRETDLGRRAAVRAEQAAREDQAAIILQSFARGRIGRLKVITGSRFLVAEQAVRCTQAAIILQRPLKVATRIRV